MNLFAPFQYSTFFFFHVVVDPRLTWEECEKRNCRPLRAGMDVYVPFLGDSHLIIRGDHGRKLYIRPLKGGRVMFDVVLTYSQETCTWLNKSNERESKIQDMMMRNFPLPLPERIYLNGDPLLYLTLHVVHWSMLYLTLSFYSFFFWVRVGFE